MTDNKITFYRNTSSKHGLNGFLETKPKGVRDRYASSYIYRMITSGYTIKQITSETVTRKSKEVNPKTSWQSQGKSGEMEYEYELVTIEFTQNPQELKDTQYTIHTTTTGTQVFAGNEEQIEEWVQDQNLQFSHSFRESLITQLLPNSSYFSGFYCPYIVKKVS